jgi:hypothetical protein
MSKAAVGRTSNSQEVNTLTAGRQDLIGCGCDCLIPAQPPKEAIEARGRRANDPDHYHSVANLAKGEKPGERGLPNRG